VKLAITGAIIGNLLLVLGAALFFGGLRYQEQTFNAKVAGMHAVSLALAEVGLIMPAIFHAVAPQASFRARETVSVGVAGILMVLYLSSLLFSFRTHREILGIDVASSEDGAGWLAFLRGLVARGLSGVALVISDDHAGLVNAIGAVLPWSCVRPSGKPESPKTAFW